jgi:hypothetical protein
MKNRSLDRIAAVAAIVLGLAGFQACRGSNEQTSASRDAAGAGAPLVQDYLQVADAAGAETTTVDQQFLADALRKLAAALGTLNVADLEVQVALRAAAEHVLSNPHSMDTAEAVRNSLIAAAGAIEVSTGATALRQSAESVDVDRPLLDQPETIRSFLRASSDALRRAAKG